MNGFLNVLKPPGMTSAAVVSYVKRITKEKHVGHAGTLDPEAAGVLPLMLGRATRLFDYLVDKEKSYIAEVAFGASTDTQDAQGTIMETGENYPDMDKVRTASLSLVGDIEQTPSMYSAIKVGGKPLYSLAYKGEKVEVPSRIVHVSRLEVMEERERHGFLIHVDCGRGTYIRSICDDLGKLNGCPAHMRFLLRSRSGAFNLENSMTLEEISAYAQEGILDEKILPLDMPLMHLQQVRLPEQLRKLALNGARLKIADHVPDNVPLRTYLGNTFLGITHASGGELVWKTLILPQSQDSGGN